MSTINVNRMVDSQGGVLAPISSVMRNRIINGACTIDQRNAGAAVTPLDTYTLDRWRGFASVASKYTVQQNAGSVALPDGFRNYLGVTSSSAYTVGASEYFAIEQAIEGFNIADLAWGTASAKTVTLSFWVRSSLTGTFGGSILNSGYSRSYPFSYTISSANTWEYKTVTITGDTTGTWLATNGVGIRLWLGLGVGASSSGTAGVWSGSAFLSATGATSVVGTNGATFYITGVQLEKGTQATSFEYRQYGQELALCQRYYVQDGASTGSFGAGCHFSSSLALYHYRLPVTMRTAPTFSVSAASDFRSVANGTTFTGSSFSASSPTVLAARLDLTISGATAGHGSVLEHANSNAKLMFSSEL